MNEANGTAPPTLLSVRGLRTWFSTPQGPLRAVDGVSFDLAAGETLGVVGESGSGKTVLARTILGLVPEHAVSKGDVLLNGRDLTHLRERERRNVLGDEISMVFQNPLTALNPVLTVGAQIREVLRYRKHVPRRAARSGSLELLRAVGIPEPELRSRQYPHELSGGMLQRITIAIALAGDPKLLVADEPTTALDVTVQAQILDLLQRLQIERGMAMILVTHDLGIVAGRTDRTAVMYAGRIVEEAGTVELFDRPRHPYTEGLLQALPRLEAPSHTRIATIPGRVPDLITPITGCAFADRCGYAEGRCRSSAPPLDADGGSEHRYACFFPRDPRADEPAPVTTRPPQEAEVSHTAERRGRWQA